MTYSVRGPDMYRGMSVPCRAKLHHALTGIFYNWNWNDEAPRDITEEEAKLLSHVFSSQTEYKVWKETLAKINELGMDKAREWFFDQIKLLTLRDVMRGK